MNRSTDGGPAARIPLLLATVLAGVAGTPASGQSLEWSFETGGRVYSSPVIRNGTVFIGSGDGALYALDAVTGRERWRHETGGAVHSTPAVDGSSVYALSQDGFLYALSVADGGEIWRFETGGEGAVDPWDYYLSSPVVVDDLVLFGSSDHHLYALDKRSGARRWAFETGGPVHAEPAVSDGLVFAGSFDGHFYALRLDDGTQAWSFDTVGAEYFPEGAVQRGALVRDGVVYFGSRDYNLYALDAQTGKGRWNWRDPRGWVIAAPVASGNLLFFGTSDPHVFVALDVESGAPAWTLPVHMRVYGSAAVRDGVVYFGSHNGLLHAVGAETGEVLWTVETEGRRANGDRVYTAEGTFRDDFELYGERWLESEQAILDLGAILSTPEIVDGVIYFGSADGRVYAVRLP